MQFFLSFGLPVSAVQMFAVSKFGRGKLNLHNDLNDRQIVDGQQNDGSLGDSKLSADLVSYLQSFEVEHAVEHTPSEIQDILRKYTHDLCGFVSKYQMDEVTRNNVRQDLIDDFVNLGKYGKMRNFHDKYGFEGEESSKHVQAFLDISEKAFQEMFHGTLLFGDTQHFFAQGELEDMSSIMRKVVAGEADEQSVERMGHKMDNDRKLDAVKILLNKFMDEFVSDAAEFSRRELAAAEHFVPKNAKKVLETFMHDLKNSLTDGFKSKEGHVKVAEESHSNFIDDVIDQFNVNTLHYPNHFDFGNDVLNQAVDQIAQKAFASLRVRGGIVSNLAVQKNHDILEGCQIILRQMQPNAMPSEMVLTSLKRKYGSFM